jgi:hypothetical protein
MAEQNWGVSRAVRQRFSAPAELSHSDAHIARYREYTGDMLAPFGLSLGPFEHQGQSYGEMGAAVLRELLGPGEQAGLLILVYAVPDIVPGRATATYLSEVCPGKPLAFALCDQGTAGPFTALRLARDYARRGEVETAVILVVEQSLLPYDTGTGAVPGVHAAVALLTSGHPVAPVAGITVRAENVTCSGTLIASPAAAKRVFSLGELVLAPEDQPYSGVWWELAGALGTGPLTVADYDQQLGYLSELRIGGPVSDQSSSVTV